MTGVQTCALPIFRGRELALADADIILQPGAGVAASGDRPFVDLDLPLGDAGEFGHPEALVYLDGTAYAGCDCFHQEIILAPEWCDGQTHSLALFGWTGRGADQEAQLLLRTCTLRQIDQPTRELVALMRVALEAVNELDAYHPAGGQILNTDRKSTRLNSSHSQQSRMPSSA